MSFRKYNEKGEQLGIDKGGHVFEETRTEQSHKSEVDINNIVRRAGSAELISKVNALSQWKYDDVTGNDFKETMNALIKARDTFDQVPLNIRKHFGHDPAEFMDFVQNPQNKDQLIEWGLANEPEVVQPMQVEVVNPVETPPAEPAP